MYLKIRAYFFIGRKGNRRKRRKVSNFTANKFLAMQEGKRQKQIAGLIQEEITDIFQRLGMSMMDGGMVSVSSVKITPDLLEARIYVSLFQVADVAATMKKIEDRSWEVKKELATRIKHQLRRIPELRFYHDDTLDHVFKMEELFRQIKPEEGKEE
jgi:ribosome-binding factor A